MTTSVVIPAAGDKGLLNALLMRLHTYCENSIDEIVVVDNGNHWPDQSAEKEKWLHLPQNIGFGPAVNFGVARSDGDIVCIISTDVEFSENFLVRATEILAEMPCVVGGKIWDTSTGWNNFGDRLFPYVEGWLIICERSAWNVIGGFDPNFYPYDFEDVDFSTSAQKIELDLVQLVCPTLHHLGGRTIGYNPEREAITKEHREVFKKKWVDHD